MKDLMAVLCYSLTLIIISRVPVINSLDFAFQLDTFDKPSRTCEPIIVDMCKGELAYNYTGGPNFLNQDSYSQQDSLVLLTTFQPLITNGCSKQLKPFLCAKYVPMCDPQVEQLIGPCRSVCENVKRRCEPVLQTIGLPWPVDLNCSVFPPHNTEQTMCMEFPEEDSSEAPDSVNTPAPTLSKEPTPDIRVTEEHPIFHLDLCSEKRNSFAYQYSNTSEECRARCDVNNLFNTSEKQFAEVWMAVWTSFCFLFSILTVITFFIDPAKFKYPKRPIIFLSLCYAMYSIAYLLRLIAGRNLITCDSEKLMTQELENTNCAAIFLLLYYFSTAAALWWVILCLTWLFSAGLKWSHDAIELCSSYFHLVAWGIPAVQSIVIIVLRDVSSEELTALCFVGINNPQSLLWFVIVPFAVYLLLGIALLLAGYILLFCQEKKEATKCDEKIEVLMVRIGIFSLLYTVPSTCLLACYFYEYFNQRSWFDSSSTNTPSIEIYILKILSGLLPGATSGLCVLGCNSLDIWANACSNKCVSKYSRTATKALHQSNNNNNTARQYMPVKSMSSRHHPNAPSHHSSSRSSSRSHHKHYSNHHTIAGQSLQFPGEYHV